MAMQALGQGYTPGAGGSAFSSVASSMIEIGRRKNSFQQELAARAMDHELSSIREQKTRDWQSTEAAKDRKAARKTARTDQAARILAARDQQAHEGTMLERAQSHEGSQAALGRIYDSLTRRDTFDHESRRADQDSNNRIREANNSAAIVKKLSSRPRIGGSYSAPGVAMSSDTEHRDIGEVGAEARAPRKKAKTPLSPAAESPAVASKPVSGPAPAAPLSAPVKSSTWRVGPKPTGPQRRQAVKEDRSGGIKGMQIKGL